MHCSLKDNNFAARLKKMLTSCYFVHSGSIGLIQGKHARYVIKQFSEKPGVFAAMTLYHAYQGYFKLLSLLLSQALCIRN